MSRRPAACLTAPCAAILAVLALTGLTGCRSGGHESPAPAPTAASNPGESPETTLAQTSAPAAAGATPAEAGPAGTAPPDAAAAAAAAPPTPFTPGTSLPGAIPPSPSPAPDASAAPSEKPADALQWLADSEARNADYKRRLAEADASVASASGPVAEWERNVLAFKNPFLPRPQLSPEDAQAIVGKDGGERVRWAEGRLAAAVSARDAAQKTLDDLKANPPAN